ncbi:MAG: CocE/NonD family hydrolase C-terminal non-catalytic domain-containing protein [Gemmatimonadaceae bacterium]
MAASVPIAYAQQPSQRKESIADTGIAGQSIRLYLSPIRVDSGYRLTPNGYSGATHVEQNEERQDSARVASVIGTPTRKIDTRNGVQFVSPPLAGPFELSGVFSGRLELISNKQSFDFEISLYELTPSGDYVLVSSYSTHQAALVEGARHMSLQPGIRQFVDFNTAGFASRLIQNGSRLVVLVTLLISPKNQIAAANGIADLTTDSTNVPLKIGWYGNSYIDLRVRHR